MRQNRDIRNALLRSALIPFIQRSFQTLSGVDQYRHNWHIEAVAWQLEQCFRGETNRLIINLPPRHLKSICASVAFVAWLLGRRPKTRVILVSYSQDLVAKLARDIRATMQSDWYREAFPGTRLSDNKNTELEFETTERGSVFATSTAATLTGRGADYIIIDDPLKASDALSEERRSALNQWYGTTLYTRLNNKKAGVIIIVTQRLHVDDLVGHVLRAGDWNLLSIPAIAEETTRYEIGPGLEHEFQKGEVLHPEHEDKARLEVARAQMGSYNFAAQYQQNPYPPRGNLIKAEWLNYYQDPLDRTEFDLVAASWDTGSVLGETASYSVCTVWGVKDGRYYLIHVMRQQLEYPELKRRVFELARRFRADVTLIEHTSTGIPLIQDLRRSGFAGLVPFGPRGDKLSRIDAQSAKFEAGRVHLPEQASWLSDLVSELLSFPNSRHDDQVDSVSQFLEWIGHSEWVRRPIERPNPVRREVVRREISPTMRYMRPRRHE